MRILHVVPSYFPAWRYGGPIKSVHGLCKGLVEIGNEVHVYTTNADGPQCLDVPLNVPVAIDGVSVRYYASDWLRRLYWSGDMSRALNEDVSGFDIVHLHSIFLWPTTAAATAARAASVPYVLAPRGMLVRELIRRKSRWLKSAWIEIFERSNLESAALIHFTSRLEKEAAESLGFKIKAACVVPNGVDNEEVDDTADLRALPAGFPYPGRRFLLYIGRINWEKGLDRLLRALPFAPDCHLVIAGNDEENYRPQLELLARQLSVAGRITFLGPVYGTEKRALLEHAAGLILPSYSENFGNVVLEGMACGCPVIVTPEVGAADLVRESEAGLVLEGSPETLGAGIAELIANPTMGSQMGQRGRDAVIQRFRWESIARRMEAEYRQVLQRVRSSAL